MHDCIFLVRGWLNDAACATRPCAQPSVFSLLLCCGTQAVGEVEYFSLKEGARPPSEAELRKKLMPGELRCTAHAFWKWCLYLLPTPHCTGSAHCSNGQIVCLPLSEKEAFVLEACDMLDGRSSLYTLHLHFTRSRLTGCPTMHCCAAEEACALEACYVAAFRMKQRGLVLHEKLDKAAVSCCCCVGFHVMSAMRPLVWGRCCTISWTRRW